MVLVKNVIFILEKSRQIFQSHVFWSILMVQTETWFHIRKNQDTHSFIWPLIHTNVSKEMISWQNMCTVVPLKYFRASHTGRLSHRPSLITGILARMTVTHRSLIPAKLMAGMRGTHCRKIETELNKLYQLNLTNIETLNSWCSVTPLTGRLLNETRFGLFRYAGH